MQQELGLAIGDHVMVKLSSTQEEIGTIQFIGRTEFSEGIWYGVELEKAVGKNSGSVNGVAYFSCGAQHGLFARRQNITKVDTRALMTPWQRRQRRLRVDTNSEQRKESHLPSEMHHVDMRTSMQHGQMNGYGREDVERLTQQLEASKEAAETCAREHAAEISKLHATFSRREQDLLAELKQAEHSTREYARRMNSEEDFDLRQKVEILTQQLRVAEEAAELSAREKEKGLEELRKRMHEEMNELRTTSHTQGETAHGQRAAKERGRRVPEEIAEKDVSDEHAKMAHRKQIAKKIISGRPDPEFENHAHKPSNRVFVNRLPASCSDQILRDYFSEFGHIAEGNAFVKVDREDPCGYVIFDDAKDVEKTIKSREKHTMHGTQVNVKKCVPCADAEQTTLSDVAAERQRCAERLASKGFTVKWLLTFWRNYGETPEPQNINAKVLEPAEGEWRGVISKTSTTKSVVREIVIPETSTKKCCYMDLMPNFAERPSRFVSHWWGASFYDVLLSILQHATGLRGNMLAWYIDYEYADRVLGDDVLLSTYWMSVFAVNPHVSFCGMCDDCNVVCKGTSCHICHMSLEYPCKCGSSKYRTGHAHCEMDKFDTVLGLIRDGLVVALDSKLECLERVWVLNEIGKALEMNKQLSWQMPNEIDDKFCGAADAQLASIQDSWSTLKEDKDRILQQVVHTCKGGISGFDALVSSEVMPILRNYAATKLVNGKRPAHDIKQILKRKADVNFSDDMGRSLIFLASSNGRNAVAKLLIEAEANIENADIDGFTPLLISADKGHGPVVKVLLAKGTAINQINNKGCTPLFLAAQNGHTSVVEILLDSKANINRARIKGHTPLKVATECGQGAVVELLMNAKADVDAKDTKDTMESW